MCVVQTEATVALLLGERFAVGIFLGVLGDMDDVEGIDAGIAIAYQIDQSDIAVGGSGRVQPHTQFYYRVGVDRCKHPFVVLLKPHRHSPQLFRLGGSAIEAGTPSAFRHHCFVVKALKTLYGRFRAFLHVIHRHVVVFGILLRCPVDSEGGWRYILYGGDVGYINQHGPRTGAKHH